MTEVGQVEDLTWLNSPAGDGFLEDGFVIQVADFLGTDVIDGSA